MRSDLRHLPPLDALKGFVAVCRRMSITQGAADLCLSQSAVSRQIRQLEAHLEEPLLVRRHRAIDLTPAGHALLSIAAPLMEALESFYRRRIEPLPESLTITAPSGFASLWLLPRVGRLRQMFSHADLRIITDNRVLDMATERIDLAIRYWAVDAPPERGCLLCKETVVPVAAANDAPDGQVLLEFDHRSRAGLRWEDWFSLLRLDGARRFRRIRFNRYEQALDSAVRGEGMLLARLPITGELLSTRMLRALATPTRETGFGYWLVQGEQSGRLASDVAHWIRSEAYACWGHINSHVAHETDHVWQPACGYSDCL